MLLLSNLGVKPTRLLRETGNSALETDPRIPPNQKKRLVLNPPSFSSLRFRYGRSPGGRGSDLRPEFRRLRLRQEDAPDGPERAAEPRGVGGRGGVLGRPLHRHHGSRRADQVSAAGKHYY